MAYKTVLLSFFIFSATARQIKTLSSGFIMATENDREHRFSLPRLYMVSNSPEHRYPAKELPGLVREITSRIPAVIQLREKHLPAGTVHDLAIAVRKSIADNRSCLVVNERFDIALSAGTIGVHFPENACPLNNVRSVAPDLIQGKSVHSIEGALDAENEGADYLVAGPVFDTPLKRQYGPPLGPELFGRICADVSLPVYAIGGITPVNTPRCLDNGAYGIAALSLFRSGDTLYDILESFNRVLEPCV